MGEEIQVTSSTFLSFQMLAEIVQGTFNGSNATEALARMSPNTTRISHFSEVYSILQAVLVFSLGIYLRYVRATSELVAATTRC